MTSQVIFKIDKKLKEKAMKKARGEGVPFAAVLKMATKAFAEGRLNVSLEPSEEEFNAKTSRLIARELKEIREGKNMSPVFNNAKDAIAYLKNL